MQLISKKISIIGSGWLGFPLAKQLIAQGYQVNASTTSSERLVELAAANITPFILDIKQPVSQLNGLLKGDILIVNIPSKDITGFKNLIIELEKTAITKVIFISSTSVYKNENKIVDEEDKSALLTCPLLAIEALFQASKAFKTTIVRFCGLIGYSRHPGYFFKQGKQVNSADAPVNLIHRDDCINIIIQIIEQGRWGEVFNACADTHPTKREFYSQACKKVGRPIPVFEQSKPVSYKIISNSKVKQHLQYQLLYPDLMAVLDEWL